MENQNEKKKSTEEDKQQELLEAESVQFWNKIKNSNAGSNS